MQKRVISKMWLNVTVLEQKKNRATVVVWHSEKNTVVHSS